MKKLVILAGLAFIPTLALAQLGGGPEGFSGSCPPSIISFIDGDESEPTPSPAMPTPTSAPYTGPQVVGVPVSASQQGGTSLVLPTINVMSGQSLALCVKAAGGPTQSANDNLGNTWAENAAVASGSSGAIHMLFSFTPAVGLTTVQLPQGCPTCYLGAILIQLTNAHDVAAAIGNPFGTPTSPMQVTNGPLTLATAANRLALACAEIEAAPNTGLSLQPYPFVDDSTGDAAGIPVITFVQGASPHNGFTLGAAVAGVQDVGPYEIDLPYSPTEPQAGALAIIE